MYKSWRISRRSMLKGVGVSMALPLLDIMEPEAHASDANPETRVAYLYFPNGYPEGGWAPERVGANGEILQLNEWMSPLESHKGDIVIPRNVWTPRGNGHGAGTATWLTGYGYDGRRIDAGGISVDQIAAKSIGSNSAIPSLELSLKGEGFFSKNLPRNNISWSNSNIPCSREVEPRRVFDRVFGRPSGVLSDRSVIDAVLEEASDLRRQASQADQRKIDEYLESIRSIERRLEFSDEQSQRAAKDEALADRLVRPAAGIPDDHEAYVRLMMDMMVLAFWSGSTRVCSFMLDHGQSNRYFNFIDGVEGTWHALSHYRDISGRTEDDDGKTSWSSVSSKRTMFNRVIQWHHEQVAYLLSCMKSISDGDGTLLDQSLVVYGSSISDGHEHGARDLPTLVAGSGGGSVRPGRVLDFRRPTSMSKLHLSVLHSLGVPVDRFAEADEPLSELGG